MREHFDCMTRLLPNARIHVLALGICCKSCREGFRSVLCSLWSQQLFY